MDLLKDVDTPIICKCVKHESEHRFYNRLTEVQITNSAMKAQRIGMINYPARAGKVYEGFLWGSDT